MQQIIVFIMRKGKKNKTHTRKNAEKKKQKGRRCLAYFSGGKTFRKNVKKAKNVTNHCFYNAKNAKKTKRIREKMRKKKGKIKADDASHIFLGAKLLGKRRKERQMQQIIVFIMRKCEKKKNKTHTRNNAENADKSMPRKRVVYVMGRNEPHRRYTMLAIVCLSFSTSLEPPATVADVQGAGSGGGCHPLFPARR